MAEKRMTSLKIVDTDAFLDMPLTAQALYFHLNQRADDDGFVSSAQKIKRSIGAKDSDLSELIRKGFIITFPSGIVVIKHWWINNYIRSDRYHKTTYRDEWNLLVVKENGAYSLAEDGETIDISTGDTNGIPHGIPDGDECSSGDLQKPQDGNDAFLRGERENAEISEGATVGIPSDNQNDTDGMLRLDKIRLDKSRIDKGGLGGEDSENVSDVSSSPPLSGDGSLSDLSTEEKPKRQRKPKEPKEPKNDIDPFVEFAGDDEELLKTFADFEEMRNQKKKPMTRRAKSDMVLRLKKMSPDRNVWIKSLAKSINRCWLDVWEPDRDEIDEKAERAIKREENKRLMEQQEAEAQAERDRQLEEFRRSMGLSPSDELPRGNLSFIPKGVDD